MCPMATLFILIEGPCKSIWNSLVKLDLFSSAIFKIHLSANIGLFLLDYLCFMCILFIVILDYHG